MKLYGSPGSPFARKVRIVLAEKNIAHDYIVARGSAPDSPVPAFNPLGKIPTLVRDDGRALYDSPVIVEYLDALGSGPKLIPEDFESRIEVKRWEALGDGITEATVNINHGTREFCFGNRFTLADIAAGYALGYLDFALPEVEWRKAHPALAQLELRLAARPSFSSTVQAPRT